MIPHQFQQLALVGTDQFKCGNSENNWAFRSQIVFHVILIAWLVCATEAPPVRCRGPTIDWHVIVKTLSPGGQGWILCSFYEVHQRGTAGSVVVPGCSSGLLLSVPRSVGINVESSLIGMIIVRHRHECLYLSLFHNIGCKQYAQTLCVIWRSRVRYRRSTWKLYNWIRL